MPSKRKYDLAECKNPRPNTHYFIPHDKRQVFCNSDCKGAFHNDKRSLAVKKRAEGEMMLKTAYLFMEFGISPFSRSWLELLKIDLNCATIQSSTISDASIYWFVNYGLKELDKETYKIVCRNQV